MIHHVAVWVSDLEKMKGFYSKYFDGVSGALYRNPKTGFRSYFLAFGGGCRLELMQSPAVGETKNNSDRQLPGLAHISFSAGSAAAVDELTDRLVREGCALAGAPRTTGDGYYESCVFDPELNRIEITI